MIRYLLRRNIAACFIAVVVFTGIVRADILESDFRKWRDDYRKDNGDKVVESDLAAGTTAITPENQAKIELGARVRTAEAKFNNPAHLDETKRWFDGVAAIIEKGVNKQTGAEADHHQEYLKIFAAESAKTALRVLEKPIPDQKLQTGVSIARMMAKLAEYGQEDALYVLLPLLDPSASIPDANTWFGSAPPQLPTEVNEGAMYWAAKGVANFYAWRNKQAKPPAINNKPLETEVIAALMRILRNRDASVDGKAEYRVTDDAPDDRLNGFRMLRREVIVALGQSGYPSVKTDKDELLIALELGRVVHGSNVVPMPRLDERVDAAIGLLSMNPTLDSRYQPDYAMSKVGEFSALLADRYAKRNSAAMEREGIRLAEELGRGKQNKSASEYEKKVADLAIAFLKGLGNAQALGKQATLREFMEKNPPSGESIFKDMESSSLSGAARAVRDNWER